MARKPLVILGATGVGKTDWLLSHFSNRDCVVVNVDSVQVYKYFDIGSAKASLAERTALPHVMIDERDPLDTLSVNAYVDLAHSHIKEIQASGKQVIIAGGTPYYLKHLLWGAPSVPPVDPVIRAQVADWVREVGGLQAYRELGELDPIATLKFASGDVYRTSRAWEVYRQTGRILSSFKDLVGGLDQDFTLIGLERPRPLMWERSRERVDKMIANGLEAEIDSLIAKGYEHASAMDSIGYREWIVGRKEGLSREGIAEAIYLHTRQYVKRQMTFFRSFSGVNWFDLENPRELEAYLGSLSL